MKLGHQAMTNFEGRLEGKDRAIRMEAEIKEGRREGRRQREEIGAGIKVILDRMGLLIRQVRGATFTVESLEPAYQKLRW